MQEHFVEGSQRGETRSEYATACGLRLSGAPRYLDAPQGQRTKTTLFVSDTLKNASGASEAFLFRKE